MDSQFWKGKKVFITGHTGFKGGWLSLWLQELGAEVTGFALAPKTKPAMFALANIGDGMHSILEDIRDLETLLKAMRQASPEIVFHLAAQPLVRYSYNEPVETYSTNVMGTVHLLESVRKVAGVRAVVIVTSDKCYENREWYWGYREDEPMGGFDPYSSSKGCSELVVSAFRRSFFPMERYFDHGVAIASARAGNVIGGGDWAEDRLIPDILRAIDSRMDVHIRNPTAVRPWQHVLEPLSGYLELGQKLFEEGPAFAEAWNFGPNDVDARPVEWIVNRLVTLWGEEARYCIDGAGATLHEARYLKLDVSKAHVRLNWGPRWSLATCLEKIVTWHRAYRYGADLRQTSIQQIIEFCDEANRVGGALS